VVVHALGEVLRGARAVVAPFGVLLGLGSLRRGGLLGSGGAAGEETADGMADGGTDSYTTIFGGYTLALSILTMGYVAK
jgi:hypothetical protein